MTREELDFRIEAANTQFFKQYILTEEGVTCPSVIEELTTERIFTMTYVDGRTECLSSQPLCSSQGSPC